jgi:hypothetical protein
MKTIKLFATWALKYTVKLGVYVGAPEHCGYSGPGSVPGDMTVIDVVSVAIPK